MSDKIEARIPPPIGPQIRQLREERGLTLSDLARLVGTSAPTMHRYEGGWDRFELGTLRKIANALDAVLEVRLISSPGTPQTPIPTQPDLLSLAAPLFWDHELTRSDLEEHSEWVLGRILMFGSHQQVKAARAHFGNDAIRRTLRRREIDSRTRHYWKLILEDPCIPES